MIPLLEAIRPTTFIQSSKLRDHLGLDVTIATNSIFSDNEKLTAHLKAPDFFDVKRFPKATFTSTKIEKADKNYKVTGDLTLVVDYDVPANMIAKFATQGALEKMNQERAAEALKNLKGLLEE